MKYGLIGFDHYKIDCIIGLNPDERIYKQTIYIDLRVEHDFSLAKKHDCLEQTICYEELGKLCEALSLKEYRLLETFASEILETLMNQYQIKWAFVRIKKPSALPLADYAVIELETARE